MTFLLLLKLTLEQQPVVLVPPFYGTNLWTTYNQTNLPWFCPQEENDTLLWVGPKFLLPHRVSCFFNLMTTFLDENGKITDWPNTTVSIHDFGGDESTRFAAHLKTFNISAVVTYARIVDTFKEGALVCDAMCGIGPFAVRAAKRKHCHVRANDLNPDSYKWLCENCKINGVQDNVECFNMDAREFIKKQFDDGGCDYIVMNLPATAVEFLDAVGEGALKNKETARMPIVIFHAFDNKEGDYETSLRNRAQQALGSLPLPHMDIHNVRDVSPGKFMFRCTFSCADIFLQNDDKPAPLAA